MRIRRFVIGSVAAAMLLLAACGNDSGSSNAMGSGPMMSPRSMTAGGADVKVEPKQMSKRGAMFKVSMDTHAGSLEMNMERGMRLSVGGKNWPMESWKGDGPGGHHREGELRFRNGGPVRGMARLTMTGFDRPMMMQWNMR